MGGGGKVLEKTGSLIKVHSVIYKAVFQEMILYGIKIWVVTYAIMKVIEAFYHSIARQVFRVKERKGDAGEWEWALVDAAFENTGIFPIRGYMKRQ